MAEAEEIKVVEWVFGQSGGTVWKLSCGKMGT